MKYCFVNLKQDFFLKQNVQTYGKLSSKKGLLFMKLAVEVKN
jgi:hypothetical protein